MMEPDDDYKSDGDPFDYTSDGDPLFDEMIDNDNLPSQENALPKEEEEKEEETTPANTHRQKQRVVGGAAVVGGVTVALLSVPLVAIDVTVLAVAGPVVAVAAAGGAALVAANHSSGGKLAQAGGEAMAHASEELRRRNPLQMCTGGGDCTDSSTTPFPREWVPGVFRQRNQNIFSKEECKEDLVETDQSSSELESCSSFTQRKEREEEEQLEVEKLADKWLQPKTKDSTKTESHEKPGRSPLGWLAKWRMDQIEKAAEAAAKQEEAQVVPERPAVGSSNGPTWGRMLLARQSQRNERNDDDGGWSSGSDSEGGNGEEYDSDDDSDHYSNSDEEEEVVFALEDDSVRYPPTGALFSNGIVEQANPVG